MVDQQGGFYLKLMEEQFPKCPICASSEGYEFSGLWGTRFAQCRTCKAKWKISVKKNKIRDLMLHELPKEGSAVYTIIIETNDETNSKPPLFSIIGIELATDFWLNLKLNKEINWEILSEDINSEVSEAIFKEDNEILLYQWEGTRSVMNEGMDVWGKPTRNRDAESGILLMSTHKLRWLAKRGREKDRSLLVVQEIPLEDIKGVTGKSADSNEWKWKMKTSIVDNRGETVFWLRQAFLEVIKPLIEGAVQIRKKEIKAEKKKERFLIALDFSFLKNYMKKGGLIMQVLKCPECSGKIEFPESGKRIRCSYCGHTIYANDIFEKVKLLLE